MDIVKKLNPFKRVHVPAPLGSLYEAEVSGRHQTHTALHQLPRSAFAARDSERKRSARAAATEKELLHLNHKIVSNHAIMIFITETSLPKVTREQGHVATKVIPHWLQRRVPNSPPKLPLSVDRSPNPITCLITKPVRPMMPNAIRIRSAVFPQCTGQTDRPTDRPRESLTTIGRYAS